MRVCIEYDLALDSTKKPTREMEREGETERTESNSARKLKVVRAKFKVEHVQ